MNNSMPPNDLDRLLAELRNESDPCAEACLVDDVLMGVAAGCLDENVRHAALDHVVRCRTCASKLQEYLVAFAEPFDDCAQLSSVSREPEFLKTWFTSPETGKPVVEERKESRRVTGWFRGWRWVAAGAVPLAAALAFFVALPSFSLYRARTLVAQSEIVDRSSEFRLSGSPWAPPRTTRSAIAIGDQHSNLTAARQWLSRTRQSVAVLFVTGRLAMAENDPASAAESFRQVTKLTPADPQSFNDYGAALAALSVTSRDNAVAERALAAFDQALLRDARDSAALFNKALVLDFLGRQQEACNTLRTFMDIERDPRWKAEARARLLC